MNPCHPVRDLRAARAALARFAALASLAIGLIAPRPAAAGVSSALGPDDGYAGNPPDYFNCTACHDSYAVNSGQGGVQLLDLPPAFVPGNAYDLMVRIYDPEPLRMKWGFELTVLDASAQQAGSLVVLDPVETQLSDNGGTDADFIKHTFAGTHEGTPGPTTWTFRWVAPSAPSVTFYLAGNAANDSEDPSGDYIYTTTAFLSQAATATDQGSWGKIKSLYLGD